jgi:homoserine kinase
MKDSISVFAPATVANVACAFDVLGFAIHQPGDVLKLRPNQTGKLNIRKISGDGGKLSLDPEKNTASVSISAFLSHLGLHQGFDLELEKNMPLGSGLGSSAASSVAGVFAANEILGRPLKRAELLPFAMEGERLACGAAHADNVGPALLGGFVLISSYQPLTIRNINYPEQLVATVVHPRIIVGTRDSREVLRQKINLKTAANQWGHVAGLIAGLMSSDFSLIGQSLHDFIIEPVRAVLIPGFYQIKQISLENEALGCSISGSGPSVFALFKDRDKAEKAGEEMKNGFKKIGIEADVFVSPINATGPKILG